MVSLLVNAANEIVWLCWAGAVTAKVWSTLAAAKYCAFPAWLARTVTTPTAPVRVIVLPTMVAGPLTILKLTAKPDVAVAETANGNEVVSLLVNAANEIVCGCCTVALFIAPGVAA